MDLWAGEQPQLRGSPPNPTSTPVTYAEVVNDNANFATALKDPSVAPNALIFAPVICCWEGYTSLQNASDGCGPGGTCYSSDIWFLDSYLSQMNTKSTLAGKRLLDVLDLHYYSAGTRQSIDLATNIISLANPTVINWPSHGLVANDVVAFQPYTYTPKGVLPANMTVGQPYYVLSAGLGPNSFQIAATPGGAPINTAGNSESGYIVVFNVNDLLQAPRSLWDPSYSEPSYITDSNHLNGPMKLIPRLDAKIANGYPGTKLAFSEWAFGDGATIFGGIASADALGTFGREGMYAAFQYPVFYWVPNVADAGNEFNIGAYKMYRNYDGSGGHFGDISVSAVASDNAQMSIYASLDSTDPKRMVLVLINKTATSPAFTINFQNTLGFYRGDVYLMNSAGSGPVYAGVWDKTNYLHGNQISVAAGLFPPYSVVTVNLTASSPHDFNANSMSDILFRNSSAGGTVAMWLMNGASVASSGNVATVPNTYTIVGQRDFDDDGKADLLWRDTSGNVYMWFMNGPTMSSSANLGNVPNTWTVLGTADMNGDGLGDILWQNTSGDVAIWFMNGSTISSSADLGTVPPSSNWSIVWETAGTILWKNTASNPYTYALWQVNGSTVTSTVLGSVPSNWVVQGIGDFNGDGVADILWRDTSAGTVAIWFLNSSGGVQSSGTVGAVSTGTTWAINETGDFDSNGMSDILWVDGSGNVSIWFMNGATIASSVSLGNVGTSWTVQSANSD